MTLVAKIGTVDYAATGAFDLTSLTTEPASDTAYGTAHFRLSQRAGGLAVAEHAEVQIYDLTAGAITQIYFAGHVSAREYDSLGNNQICGITARDYSELLDTLALESPLTLNGASAFADVVNAVNAAQNSPTQLIGVTFPGFAFTVDPVTFPVGTLLRAVVADRLAAIFSTNHYYRMAYTVYPVVTGGVIRPNLWIYNAAATPTPDRSFSDTPTGGQLPYYDFAKRTLDGANLGTRVLVRGAAGLVGVALDATAAAAAPNAYNGNGAAWTVVVTDTGLLTQTACDARAAWELARRAYSRESIQFGAWVPVALPGYVAISNAFSGLANVIYPVARVQYNFRNPMQIKTTVTCGARLLELGEAGGGLGAVISRDTVPPGAPTGLTLTAATFNWATLLWDCAFAWTANSEPDLDPAFPYEIERTLTGVRTRHPIGPSTLTWTTGLPYPSTYSVRLRALDSSGNLSAYSAAVPGSLALPTPPTPTWLAGGAWIGTNTFDPTTQRTLLSVVWNVAAAGDHVDFWQLVVGEGLVGQTIYTLPAAGGAQWNTTIALPGVAYTFVLLAHNSAGGYSVATTVRGLTAASAAAVGNGVLNPSFEQQAPGGPATQAAFWSGTVTGAGANSRSQAGGAADGLWAARLDAPTGSSSTITSTPVGYSNNVRYTLSIYYLLTATATGTLVATVNSGTAITIPLTGTVGAWTEYHESVVFSGNGGASVVLVATGTGTIYLDNITLTAVLPVERGGTGAITTVAARVALGLGTAAVLDVPASIAGLAGLTQVVRGDDPRLANTRAPTAHKTSHAIGGADTLTSVDFAAAPAALVTITTSTTLTSSQYIIPASAAAGAITLTLPAASAGCREYWIFRTNSIGGSVTIAAAGSDTINGAATITLTAQYAFAHIVSDGTALWMRM